MEAVVGRSAAAAADSEDGSGCGQRAPRPLASAAAAAADSMRDEQASADAAGARDSADASAALEPDELQDSADSQGDGSSNGESDSDCASESSCLGAMTSSGQQHYLRLGHTPRRRSALRLSRIIARRQLLWKLSQGRDGAVGPSCSKALALQLRKPAVVLKDEGRNCQLSQSVWAAL